MTTKKYIDFHTHTYYSDGIGTPEMSVRMARIKGLDFVAITDHDKTDGYEEALIAGKEWGIKVIPGVEVSTDVYHILGLGVNPENPELIKFLEKSNSEQRNVCIARINYLQSKGVPITLEKVVRTCPVSRLGKFNILYTMLRDSDCRDFFVRQEGRKLTKKLYEKYLRNQDGKEEVVDKNTSITAPEAIKQIHNAGGIAIIAHPFKEVKELSELDRLIEAGLDGLEIQPGFNGENDMARKYAAEHNLPLTYGSDYHGGLFGRQMLEMDGDNILDERIARALRIGGN